MVSSSTACARVLVAQLVAQGVREVVLCPGSRSAPLALAVFDADAVGHLRLHVRTDERSAGFLALGLAKASGAPVAVVTTSGTAVGNLLPAVMEASHSRVGLVVVSADRPAALVGFGANQTTDQVGIFGGFVRYAARVTSAAGPATWAAQAARACVAAASGPVHLNVELDVPLVPTESDVPPVPSGAAVPLRRPDSAVPAAVELPAGPRTVIVAGDGPPAVGAAAIDLARAAGLPLIAEPSSNARVAPALRCGRLVLGTSLAAEVERVVVFGHPTLSRPVMRLLARADVEVIAVADGDWPDPGHRVRLVVPAVAIPPSDPAWLRRWADADAAASERVDAVLAEAASTPMDPRETASTPSGPLDVRTALTGWALADAVWRAASGLPLVIGSSQPIRDADLAPIAERPPVVYANRGLAGIDGTVSTAAGIALATGRPTILLCGDLTFGHDGNGLAIGPGEPRPDLRIVVADDSGGSIFATLEYGHERFAPAFERVFTTATGTDLAALAAAHGVPALRVSTAEELDAALARPIDGLDVVVVALDRSRRRELDQAMSPAR